VKLADFYRSYDHVLANWYSLSEQVRHEADQVRLELHEELARWRPGTARPNWDRYAERINSKCREQGVPALFASVP
jgi:hypothetical protein